MFGHHYASITGLAPMLGPAVAVIWGWVPAMLWVVFGAVLVRCVHDFSALVVSMRAKGMSIGKAAEGVIGPRAKVLFLADSTFATGSNLSSLADRGMEAVMPVEQTKLPDENPADRADETQAVPEEDWPKLPRRVQAKKLDRAALVYDEEKDCYHCPLGRELAFETMKMQARDTGEASMYRVYTCGSCEGCGLAADCLKGKNKRRTVSHDQHEAVRRNVALRLKTESGKKTHARRALLAETPNGFIKDVLGLRQFLLRGLDFGSYRMVMGMYGLQYTKADDREAEAARRRFAETRLRGSAGLHAGQKPDCCRDKDADQTRTG